MSLGDVKTHQTPSGEIEVDWGDCPWVRSQRYYAPVAGSEYLAYSAAAVQQRLTPMGR